VRRPSAYCGSPVTGAPSAFPAVPTLPGGHRSTRQVPSTRLPGMAHERAGQPAQPEDLIDVDQVVGAYFDLRPDPANPDQRVVFGTSGRISAIARGRSFTCLSNNAIEFAPLNGSRPVNI